MRIAHITCNLECGGSMAMVSGLSAKLAELGHEVDVVCLDRPTGSDHERLWRSWLDKHQVSWQSLNRKQRRPGVTSAAKLWWLIQRRHYDVVHSHLALPDAITGVVRRLSSVRFRHVLTVHNTQEPRPRPMAACASGADVIYCSAAARRHNPLSAASSVVIPNGILQSDYQHSHERVETRRRLLLADDAVVVIAVGRMCPQKNFSSAVDAIATLKRRAPKTDMRYLFCGDGPDLGCLQTHARDLGLDGCVKFLGNRTDIPALLAASDVFLSTSLFEGMPLAVLEALTVGLPCVLSSIEEHLEIASTMPGCVFAPPNAPDDIASAIQLVMNDRPPASVLRASRASLLEKFSIGACVAAYADFYQSLLRGDPSTQFVVS